MQQGIKKLQWFEYLIVVFLEILNAELCRVFAYQVTHTHIYIYLHIILCVWFQVSQNQKALKTAQCTVTV